MNQINSCYDYVMVTPPSTLDHGTGYFSLFIVLGGDVSWLSRRHSRYCNRLSNRVRCSNFYTATTALRIRCVRVCGVQSRQRVSISGQLGRISIGHDTPSSAPIMPRVLIMWTSDPFQPAHTQTTGSFCIPFVARTQQYLRVRSCQKIALILRVRRQ